MLLMNVKSVQGSRGRETEAKPLKRLCAARRPYTALKRGDNESAECTKVTIMDSFAPAHSVLAGLWLRSNSFRRFPLISIQRAEGRWSRMVLPSTYLTCLDNCGRMG